MDLKMGYCMFSNPMMREHASGLQDLDANTLEREEKSGAKAVYCASQGSLGCCLPCSSAAMIDKQLSRPHFGPYNIQTALK
jgi:hypothetical protein